MVLTPKCDIFLENPCQGLSHKSRSDQRVMKVPKAIQGQQPIVQIIGLDM